MLRFKDKEEVGCCISFSNGSHQEEWNVVNSTSVNSTLLDSTNFPCTDFLGIQAHTLAPRFIRHLSSSTRCRHNSTLRRIRSVQKDADFQRIIQQVER